MFVLIIDLLTTLLARFVPIPMIVFQLMLAWMDPCAFVWAGRYIAPNRKNIAATLLAALYMCISILLIAIAYKREPEDFWKFLEKAIGISVSIILIAALGREGYKDKVEELEPEASPSGMV